MRCLAGLFQMNCVVRSDEDSIWAVVTPCLVVAFLLLVLLWIYFAYRHRLIAEWETMRINGLKRR